MCQKLIIIDIRNGTYPFTVDVYAVVRDDSRSNPRIQELIDWMLSPQGQELIEKTGYVGVATNRNNE
jgi:phosphate transport system substrate-binding protein